MTRSNGGRIGVIVGAVVLAVAIFGGFAGSAGAATINPCKILKKSEIQTAFGGTVSNGKKGLTTPVSTQCEYNVSADGDRPDGTVVVHVMFKNGKVAYNGLKKVSSSYVPVEGLPKSLYNEQTQVVDVLKGDTLLGVQGVFLITDPLPIHRYDDQQQLVDLAEIGLKRV
jgi:hypothetical protein